MQELTDLDATTNRLALTHSRKVFYSPICETKKKLNND